MLLMLLVFLDTAAQAPLPTQWAQFRRSGALSHISETVDIATGDRKGDPEFPYRLRYTRSSLQGAPEIKWADSATCPAIRTIVMSMRSIKMPSPAPYGVPDQSMTLTLDGTLYSFAAPSSDNMGKVTISSNVGSPVAAWIDASLKQLAPCWATAAS